MLRGGQVTSSGGKNEQITNDALQQLRDWMGGQY